MRYMAVVECYSELNPGDVAYYDGVVYVDLEQH